MRANSNPKRVFLQKAEEIRDREKKALQSLLQRLELCSHKTRAASTTRSGGKRLGFSCRTSKRNQPSDTRILESGLQNRERINTVALSHSVCGNLLW